MSTRTAARQPSQTPAKPPTEDALRAAALRHLARYAATAAGLTRVLDRRVERWRRAAEPDDTVVNEATAARLAVRRVVAALVATHVLDDAAYAEGRSRTLLRAGRSRRKVGEHLALRGIDKRTIAEALPEDGTRELAGALLLMRRRKLGAFAGDTAPDPAARSRALGIFARAGFEHDVARAALAMPMEEVEGHIDAFRGWQNNTPPKKTAADP